MFWSFKSPIPSILLTVLKPFIKELLFGSLTHNFWNNLTISNTISSGITWERRAFYEWMQRISLLLLPNPFFNLSSIFHSPYLCCHNLITTKYKCSSIRLELLVPTRRHSQRKLSRLSFMAYRNGASYLGYPLHFVSISGYIA